MRKNVLVLLASVFSLLLGILSNHLWFPPLPPIVTWPLFLLLALGWLVILILQERSEHPKGASPGSEQQTTNVKQSTFSNQPPIMLSGEKTRRNHLDESLAGKYVGTLIMKAEKWSMGDYLSLAKLSSVIGVALFLMMIIITHVNGSPSPPAPSSAKELAQFYCRALEKQEYHNIYGYTDGLATVEHQQVTSEGIYVLLAQMVDENAGKVTNCTTQSEKVLADYSSPMIPNPDIPPPGYHHTTEYRIVILVIRGSHSYQVTLDVSMEDGLSSVTGAFSSDRIIDIDRL